MSPAPLSNIEQVAEELPDIDKSLWRKETEPCPEDQKSTSTAPFGVQHEGRQWGFSLTAVNFAIGRRSHDARLRGHVKSIGGLIVRVFRAGSDGKRCPSSRLDGCRGRPGDLVPDGEAVGNLVAPSGGR
jgi:hypothetical protein